jgi:SurA N-terminal domain
MKANTFRHLATFLALCLLPAGSWGGEVLDRIVASVNDHVILQSDWSLAISYQAFLQDRRVADFSQVERRAALDHLIDGELIKQQMSSADLGVISAEEVKNKLQQIRREKVGDAPQTVWLARLAEFHLTEADLEAKVRDAMQEMRAVEARLRPGIQVDEQAVQVYYNQKFLPQLRQTGGREVPLEAVAHQIKELLVQERLNEFLVGWLRSLRNESKIHTPFDSESSGGGS